MHITRGFKTCGFFSRVIVGSVEGDKEEKETHFLNYMIRAHKKAKETLLLHPLVQAYLHLKWDAVYKPFYFLQTAYVISIIQLVFIVNNTF